MTKIINLRKLIIFIFLLISGFNVLADTEGIPTNITVTGSSNKSQMNTVRKLARMYEKEHPNVKLGISVYTLPENTSNRYALYLQTFEAKSSDIDVMTIDCIWPGDLAKNLIDLNKYGAEKLTKTMFSSMVENNIVNGRLVALPWYADCPGLYYRKDLIEKYDLEIPKTWDDLAKAAYKIQEGERKAGNPDFVGYVWTGEAYEGLTCSAFEWLCSYGGGTIVSKDKKVTLDNPNAVKALNMAKSWIGTISPKGVESMKTEEPRMIFQNGNAAFMRNWQYAYSLCEAENSKVRGNIGICSMPKGPAGVSANTSGVENIGVNKYTKHPEIAADVAIFLASAKAQKLRALEAGLSPTIKELYEDKEINNNAKYIKMFYKLFENTVNRPATQTSPNYNKVSKVFYMAVYSVLTGQDSAHSALASAAKRISEITGYPIVDLK